MEAIIITTCTNQKRGNAEGRLRARDLSLGSLNEVASDWGIRLNTADPFGTAASLYCGRGFREATTTANELSEELLIISAGLGLLKATDRVPAYDLTLSCQSSDSIINKVNEPVQPADWWEALSAVRGTETSFHNLLSCNPFKRVLIACSEAYAQLVADEIEQLPEDDRNRIRFFGPKPSANLSDVIRILVMPFDDRFDGPDSPAKGTRNDFPQRCLRFFATSLPNVRTKPDEPSSDAKLVTNVLSDWRFPEQIKRPRLSNEEIIELLPQLWARFRGDAENPSASRMLRLLRDKKKVACEQRRFASLFKIAKERYAL